jgi:hypothetical protein
MFEISIVIDFGLTRYVVIYVKLCCRFMCPLRGPRYQVTILIFSSIYKQMPGYFCLYATRRKLSYLGPLIFMLLNVFNYLVSQPLDFESL